MGAGTELRFPPSRWMFAGGAALLVCVLVLGAKLESVHGPVRADTVAGGLTARRETPALRRVADIGSELPVLVAVLALTAWAVKRRDWPGIAVALIAPTTALFLTEYVLKPLVDRTSPKGELSYPSGHATVVTALAATALLFVYRYVGPRVALLWSPYALTVVGLVAFAVVALRWHYITDSIGGVGLGLGVVLVVASAVESVRSTTMWTRSSTSSPRT